MDWLSMVVTLINLIMLLGNLAMIRLNYELLLDANAYYKNILEGKK
jgi:hypothetical protein